MLAVKQAAGVHSGIVVEGVTLCTELRGNLRLPLNLSNRDIGHDCLEQIGVDVWGPNSVRFSAIIGGAVVVEGDVMHMGGLALWTGQVRG